MFNLSSLAYEFQPHCFMVDASELQLSVFEPFPTTLTPDKEFGNGEALTCVFIDKTGGFADYVQNLGCIKLRIYND